uniref:PDZ domain-containing protein n=1 Tax=Macrostomum lignano TaxID=282301 RepID=A0A1I8FNU6_9PLAT
CRAAARHSRHKQQPAPTQAPVATQPQPQLQQKKPASVCRYPDLQFQCRDITKAPHCIAIYDRCDGIVHCGDGSERGRLHGRFCRLLLSRRRRPPPEALSRSKSYADAKSILQAAAPPLPRHPLEQTAAADPATTSTTTATAAAANTGKVLEHHMLAQSVPTPLPPAAECPTCRAPKASLQLSRAPEVGRRLGSSDKTRQRWLPASDRSLDYVTAVPTGWSPETIYNLDKADKAAAALEKSDAADADYYRLGAAPNADRDPTALRQSVPTTPRRLRDWSSRESQRAARRVSNSCSLGSPPTAAAVTRRGGRGLRAEPLKSASWTCRLPQVDAVEAAAPKPSKPQKPRPLVGLTGQSQAELAELMENYRQSRTAVVALALGLGLSLVAVLFLTCRIRQLRARFRRGGKALTSDEADYLINGMYLHSPVTRWLANSAPRRWRFRWRPALSHFRAAPDFASCLPPPEEEAATAAGGVQRVAPAAQQERLTSGALKSKIAGVGSRERPEGHAAQVHQKVVGDELHAAWATRSHEQIACGGRRHVLTQSEGDTCDPINGDMCCPIRKRHVLTNQKATCADQSEKRHVLTNQKATRTGQSGHQAEALLLPVLLCCCCCCCCWLRLASAAAPIAGPSAVYAVATAASDRCPLWRRQRQSRPGAPLEDQQRGEVADGVEAKLAAGGSADAAAAAKQEAGSSEALRRPEADAATVNLRQARRCGRSTAAGRTALVTAMGSGEDCRRGRVSSGPRNWRAEWTLRRQSRCIGRRPAVSKAAEDERLRLRLLLLALRPNSKEIYRSRTWLEPEPASRDTSRHGVLRGPVKRRTSPPCRPLTVRAAAPRFESTERRPAVPGRGGDDLGCRVSYAPTRVPLARQWNSTAAQDDAEHIAVVEGTRLTGRRSAAGKSMARRLAVAGGARLPAVDVDLSRGRRRGINANCGGCCGAADDRLWLLLEGGLSRGCSGLFAVLTQVGAGGCRHGRSATEARCLHCFAKTT